MAVSTIMAIVKSIDTEKDITTINVDAVETTYFSLTSVDVDLIIFSILTHATEDVGMVEDLHLTHTTDVVLNKNSLNTTRCPLKNKWAYQKIISYISSQRQLLKLFLVINI